MHSRLHTSRYELVSGATRIYFERLLRSLRKGTFTGAEMAAIHLARCDLRFVSRQVLS